MGYRISAILVLVVLAGTCWAAPDPEPKASPAPAPDSFRDGITEWVPVLSALIYGILGLLLNIIVFLLIHLLNGGIIPKQLLELVYQLLPFALNNG